MIEDGAVLTFTFSAINRPQQRRTEIMTEQAANAAKPITIRGVEYPSRLIASEVLEVSPSTISNAERRGTLHRVGLRKFGRPVKDE